MGEPANEFEAAPAPAAATPPPAAEARPPAPAAAVPPAKSKGDLDFEARMQKLGEEDVRLKSEAEAMAVDRQRLKKYKDALEALESGDEVRIAKAVYGQKLNLETLTKLANLPEVLNGPPEVPVEEQVTRILDARAAAEKEAKDKKEADERAAAAKKAQEELDAGFAVFLGEADALIKDQAEKFPYVASLRRKAAALTDEKKAAALIHQAVRDVIQEKFEASGQTEIMGPDEALAIIEERNASVYQETPYAPPRRPKEPTFEDEIASYARQAAVPRSPKAKEKTLDEKIIDELNAADEAVRQQARRFSR